jgi:excisionase family DNA binding protein
VESFLSARQAAARCGISERSLRRAIRAGELVAVRDEHTFRVAAADLEAFAAALVPRRCSSARHKCGRCRGTA